MPKEFSLGVANGETEKLKQEVEELQKLTDTLRGELAEVSGRLSRLELELRRGCFEK